MRTHLAFIAVLALTVAGCASPGTGQPSIYPPDVFAHRVATSEIVLYWNCSRPDAGILRVDGVAQSPWAAQPIRFLEFDLVGVNDRERTVSDVKGAAEDIQIFTNQLSPFHLELRPAGSEVRFDLYYEYRYNLNEEMYALLAGPPVPVSWLSAMTNRQLARDICSETQHRVR